MMLSLGAFGYTAAIFHLLAHGFSKALLFLGAGSVMHSTEELDIRKMGGLRKVMPLTALLFAIGALSLGGIPILAGFWSKDEILVAVNDHLPPVFIVLTLLTAFLSALYMARAMFAVFFGELRPEHEHVHDAPPTMAITMLLLGILALGFGLVSLNWPGPYDGIGTFLFFGEPEAFHFTVWLGVLSTVLAVVAFVLGYLIYARKSISMESMRSRLSPLVGLAENKYYIDELYQLVVDRIVLTLAAAVGFFDRAVLNDVGVNGPAKTVRRVGVTLRLHVTGHVYSYALAMTLGTVALAVLFWMQSAS
jgi:NADH-quinone oxidoreductase subunit L